MNILNRMSKIEYAVVQSLLLEHNTYYVSVTYEIQIHLGDVFSISFSNVIFEALKTVAL